MVIIASSGNYTNLIWDKEFISNPLIMIIKVNNENI